MKLKFVKDEWIVKHPNGEGEKRLTFETEYTGAPFS